MSSQTIASDVTSHSTNVTSKPTYEVSGPPPFDTMGLFTFLRTYARRHQEDNPNSTIESWQETLTRVVEACNTQLKVGFTDAEKQELFGLLYNLKCSVAGRFLWQLGTQTVDRLGIPSLQNCSFVVIDDPIRPFTWAMDFLMLGAGVGYRLLPSDVAKLPRVKAVEVKREDTKDADFIVPDSREGWIKLLGKVLKAHFYSGKGFTYSCTLLRSKGAPIKSFGGLASGPDILCDGIEKINGVLNKRALEGEGVIRPVDVLDIMNIIGMVVVSGNIRRCVVKGALVHTNKGLVRIEDISIGDKVLTSEGYESVNNVFVQGEQEVIKVITDDGEFECTPNHRMAVYAPENTIWKQAGKLKPYDDYLFISVQEIPGIQTSLPPSDKLTVPELDEDMAWFIGKYQESGISEKINTAVFGKNNNSEKLIKQISRFGNFSFTDETVEFHGKPECCISSEVFSEYMQQIKPDNMSVVPDFILHAKPEIRRAFLQGVFSDNSFTAKDYLMKASIPGLFDDIINPEDKTTIVSDDETFARNISTLLFSCGIDNKFYTKYDIMPYKVYLVTLTDNFTVKNIIRQSRVKDVVCSRVVETYDIEVENKHEFFCNGYLTHNSAQIAIGDCKDSEYLQAKRWDLGTIPNWRAFSNNSVVCNDFKDIENNEEFWKGYNGTGEPYGLINLDLMRSCGRLGDNRLDPDVQGVNPCSEQNLANYESCCLSELFLSNMSSKEELITCAKYMYRICKHSLSLPCAQSEETEKIVHKNMRMGIGITGYLQATEEQKCWMSDCYVALREFDAKYSKLHNYPESIKLTTVKPSGTLSIIGNCTPGVHPGFSRFYKRRVRISSESPLLPLAKAHGYHVEYVRNYDGTLDYTTQIVTFPMSLPPHTIFAENCSAIDQLEWVKKIQTDWSDNSVSVTVYYRKQELPAIKDWLRKNYNNSIKSVSFLLHSDHGFDQAPMEQINEEEYKLLVSQVTPITDLKGVCYTEEELELLKANECAGGACPMR